MPKSDGADSGGPEPDGTSAAAFAPPERLPDVLASILQTANDGLQRKLEYREDTPLGNASARLN